MDKLTYKDVYDHDFTHIPGSVSAWRKVAQELNAISDEFLAKVARPIAESGWTGPQETPREIAVAAVGFGHAQREALAVLDALAESAELFREGQRRLHTTVQVEVPALGYKVDDKGVVNVPDDPSWWEDPLGLDDEGERRKKGRACQEEIEKARDLVKEADENAARVVNRTVRREPQGFDWPREPTLRAAEAMKSQERFPGAERYIFDEMKKNIHRPEIDEIRGYLLDPVEGPPKALALWMRLVSSGAEWDHKPKLEEKYGLDSDIDRYFKIPDDAPGRALYYDVWSNIHYGFVGAAAGFSEDILQFGAREAPGAGTNDRADELSVSCGVVLWHSDKGGEGLSHAEFQKQVRKLVDDLQKAQDDGEKIAQLRVWRYSAEALAKTN